MKTWSIVIVALLIIVITSYITFQVVSEQYKKQIETVQQSHQLLTVTLRDSIHKLTVENDLLSHIPPKIITRYVPVTTPGTSDTTWVTDTLTVYPFGTDKISKQFKTENTFYDKMIKVFGKNTITSDVVVYADSLKQEWYIENNLVFKQDSLSIDIDKKMFDNTKKFQFMSGLAFGKMYDNKQPFEIQISGGMLMGEKVYAGILVSTNTIGIETKFNLTSMFSPKK